ncbi:peptidase inhibitor family I36 protein [Streptomyces mirabilis]|uniref:peptidase inhibitor family I36 protein n=1 Tax=Streptomyces mirabilis TaxID=68239 RepID=UPI00369DAC30
MHPFGRAIIVTLSLSATLAVAACSAADSGTAESGKSSKSVKVEKRDTGSNSSGSVDGNSSTTVCDGGVIVPKLPEGQIIPKVPGDEKDPKLSGDEIVPKLPECARDDTINPRLPDGHGCLDGAICIYKEPNFGGSFKTIDLYKSIGTAITFTEPGFSGETRFPDDTPIDDQISSIVNNADIDAEFWAEADRTGGRIGVKAHSENSNLSEWGLNDVISAMRAFRKA